MKSKKKLLLGVNIDHVATLRQARLGEYPSVLEAAREAVKGGADQITVHLREDRRHIQDRDVPALKRTLRVPLNLEMALHPEIVAFAEKLRPAKVCMVPEKRRELTTEGGLDVLQNEKRLARVIPRLKVRGIQISLFIAADAKQIRKAARLGADAIEIHTGRYADLRGAGRRRELERIRKGASLARSLGLTVHAGHGLTCENVLPVARIPEIVELNIGHAIVARAVFTGLRSAVREMKKAMHA